MSVARRVLFFMLLSAHGLADEAQALADRAHRQWIAHPSVYHITLGEPRLVDTHLGLSLKAPSLTAMWWEFFAAKAPNLDGQQCLQASLVPAGRITRDGTREMLTAKIASSSTTRSQFDVSITHQLALRSRRLEPGVTSNPLVPLLPAMRSFALDATELIDWTSADFQVWLDNHQLRPLPDESDMMLARRAYVMIRSTFHYAYEKTMDRVASHVATTDASDCGGLCLLYSAILRANGIPARVLAGRWATSATPDDRLNGLPYAQWHVQMEFYANGVGWVPCDVSRDLEQPERWFGRSDGDFIALHFDPDLHVDTQFGGKTQTWLQGVAFWVRGDGSLDDMTTTETWTVEPHN